MSIYNKSSIEMNELLNAPQDLRKLSVFLGRERGKLSALCELSKLSASLELRREKLRLSVKFALLMLSNAKELESRS